jgi:chromate transporter
VSTTGPTAHRVSYRTLFEIFLRAGLTFGGGVSILGTLERELVHSRRLLEKNEFMALYGIGRMVPAGTQTALAIAYGHRFRGFPGSLVALAGLLVPGISITLAATLGYAHLQGTPVLPAITAIMLPAAVALVASATVNLGRETFVNLGSSLIAVAALGVGIGLRLSPGWVLLGGGLAGLLLLPVNAATATEGVELQP